MKNKITLTLIFLISLSLSSLLKADDNFSIGVELGYGFLDVGAADTATTITNTAGTTVSHDADEEAWVGRLFGDFKIIDSLYIDAGYFVSGSVDAKFTKSGVSTTEAYTAKGFDLSLVFKADESAGFFLKGGAHASEVDGEANIVINGTIYPNSNAADSGTGYLFGAGYDFANNARVGYTYYSDLGGLSKANLGFLYLGYRF